MSAFNNLDIMPMDFFYELGYLEEEALKSGFLDQSQGRSVVMRQLYERVRLVASTNSTVSWLKRCLRLA